jgi:hypothetical protein
LNVPDEYLDKPVQCPACGLIFMLPAAGSPGQQPTAPPPVVTRADDEAGREGRPPSPWRRADDGGEPADRGSHHPWELEEEAERARGLLTPPAICLLLTGILGFLVDLMVIIAVAMAPQILAPGPGMPDWFQQQLRKNPVGPREIMILYIPFALINIVIIQAAIQMLRRRTWSLAVTGSVLAMINLGSYCCILGIPFGIYALRTLLRPEVRSAFE